MNPIISSQDNADLLSFGISQETINSRILNWIEPHRFYHNFPHYQANGALIDMDQTTTANEKRLLRVINFYHDLIYDPRSHNNEIESADLFMKDTKGYVKTDERSLVFNSIVDTKNHAKPASNSVSAKFLVYDAHNLIYGSLKTMVNDGLLMMKEYGFLDWEVMRTKRIEAMNSLREWVYSVNPNSNLDKYIEYTSIWEPKIAIYPGTFFPFHKGHLDVLKKAEAIFDKVIIVAAINPTKPLSEEKTAYIDTLRIALPNTQIETYSGLLNDFIDSKGYDITIVKGLRNATDFAEKEVEQRYTEDLDPRVKTCYVISDKSVAHISSSGIKMLDFFKQGKPDSNFTDRYKI